MNRRKFIKSIPYLAAPVIVGNVNLKGWANSPMVQQLAQYAELNDKVLVLVQMFGGNDGLNTVIPLDKYDSLSVLRPNIMIPANKVLTLPNHPNTGLHPGLSELHNMYKDGMVKVIQSVGYPNPDFSHFRSTDIWSAASNSDEFLTTGWIGRFLDEEYPNFPYNYPNPDMPDPLAIQMSSLSNPVFQGPKFALGMGMDTWRINNLGGNNVNNFPKLPTGLNTPITSSPHGENLSYLKDMYRLYNSHTTAVSNAAYGVTNMVKYPNDNYLADQLKAVARMIAGGLKTKIYLVGFSGFDTHANQVDNGDHTKGEHYNLMRTLSTSIDAFQKDLALLKVDDRVMGMTFSEFGRRIISNNSNGTDHGTAAPLFVFGKNVNSGVLGDNVILNSNMKTEDNLPMQYDFRSIYATMLHDWFCVPQTNTDDLLLRNFQLLPLVNNICNRSGEAEALAKKAQIEYITNSPNPFVSSTTIKYKSDGGQTSIQIFDNRGRAIKQLLDEQNHETGSFEINCDLGELNSGNYYARLQNGALQQVVCLVKVK